MTLRDEILSRPDCAEALAARDCGALAAILSVGRTKIISKPIGYGTVLATLGRGVGGAFLNTLETLGNTVDPDLKWTLKTIENESFDLGEQATRDGIDGLVMAGILSAEGAAALKALAIVPDVVTAHEVAAVCWSDDGQWLF